jgi:hypothetical protein
MKRKLLAAVAFGLCLEQLEIEHLVSIGKGTIPAPEHEHRRRELSESVVRVRTRIGIIG